MLCNTQSIAHYKLPADGSVHTNTRRLNYMWFLFGFIKLFVTQILGPKRTRKEVQIIRKNKNNFS